VKGNEVAVMAEDVDDVTERVMESVERQFSVDASEVTRETRFIEDLNADSLDAIELAMDIEDEFHLAIPDEEAEKIKTVGEAIDYVKAQLAKCA
jgi:acyl carrier protein